MIFLSLQGFPREALFLWREKKLPSYRGHFEGKPYITPRFIDSESWFAI
jgi:hypothetical protein